MLSQPRKPTGSWVHPKQHSQQTRVGICPSALCCETSPGALRPDAESSVQERHGAVATHPEESHESDPRDGTLLLCGEAERAGILQPEEEKAQGRLDSGLKGWG